MRRKIGIYLGTDPHAGGTFQYDLTILEALATLSPSEYAVTAIYTDALWERFLDAGFRKLFVSRRFADRLTGAVCVKTRLSVSWLRSHASRLYSAARAIAAEDCDLWIFPSQDTLSYQIPVPSLAVIHDLMHRYERRFPEVSAHGEYERRERHYERVCRWSQGILVDSEVGKRQVVESYGVAPDKIHVLPYAPPRYLKQANKGPDTEKIPEKFIFYPAQFWSHKNHKNLLLALSWLRIEKGLEINLVLAGSMKNSYQATRALVEKLGLSKSVFFLGYVPNETIVQLYRRARALVMPTFFGPTNIPPLEAFASGCPVATSGIYGTPEQVGEAALLFDPTSVEDIAQQVAKLWTDDDLCRYLAERGRRRAEQFSRASFNARFEAILGRIVGELP